MDANPMGLVACWFVIFVVVEEERRAGALSQGYLLLGEVAEVRH